MPAESTRPHLENVSDIAEQLRIQEVRYYRYLATFNDTILSDAASGEVDVDIDVSNSVRVRYTGLDFRLVLTAKLLGGSIEVDVVMPLESDEPVSFARDAVQAFGTEIALPALYHYVRQGLADLSSRTAGTLVQMSPLPPRDFGQMVTGMPEFLEATPDVPITPQVEG